MALNPDYAGREYPQLQGRLAPSGEIAAGVRVRNVIGGYELPAGTFVLPAIAGLTTGSSVTAARARKSA